MNRFTNFLYIAILLGLTISFSCKKNEEKVSPVLQSHRVILKVIGSSETNISTVAYTDGMGKNENLTSLSGTTWTTEYKISSTVQVISLATKGAGSDASATLVAEIWIDGVKRAEGRSNGTALSASARYSFN